MVDFAIAVVDLSAVLFIVNAVLVLVFLFPSVVFIVILVLVVSVGI